MWERDGMIRIWNWQIIWNVNAYLWLEKDTRRFIFVFVVNFIIFYSTPVWGSSWPSRFVAPGAGGSGGGRGEAYKFGLWLVRFCVDIYRFLLLFLLLFLFLCFRFFLFFLFFFLLLFVVFLPGIHIDVFKFKSTRAPIKDQRIKKNNNAVIMDGCFAYFLVSFLSRLRTIWTHSCA